MNDHARDERRGSGAAERRAAGPALQPDLAFVVQLRPGTATSPLELQGRVEHVVSGEALRFGSTAELIEFLARCGVPTSSRRSTP